MFTIRIYSFLLKAVCAACNFLYVTNGQRGMHPSFFHLSRSLVSYLIRLNFLTKRENTLLIIAVLKDRKALRWRIATNGGEASRQHDVASKLFHLSFSLAIHPVGAEQLNGGEASRQRGMHPSFSIFRFRSLSTQLVPSS